MHILITSGGTSEAIDSVRSITNHSTGSLGKILAEMALAKGHQVTLITTPTALKPDPQVEKAQDLHSFIHRENQEAKISSKEEYQVLFLKKNPKIISLVKEWNPAIQLIGFKLLVDVSSEELIHVARESLVKNHASMIVANDLTKIQNGQHQAYLVTDDQVLEASTKTEIAEAILRYIK